jgi:hypothetical protein
MNPFPQLHQIAPDRWEGDCRLVQVRRWAENDYQVILRGVTRYCKTLKAAQDLVADYTPVEGSYEKIRSDYETHRTYSMGRVYKVNISGRPYYRE